ncbi:MAG: phenylalanine--tRNA ligase subunit alpha [Thermoplasmata archaeon]
MTSQGNGREEEDPDVPTVGLSPVERSVLETLMAHPEGFLSEEDVVTRTGLLADAVRGSLQRLKSKHLALVEEEHEALPRVTSKGQDALGRGLPERRLLRLLTERPAGVDPGTLTHAGFTEEERSAAIGLLRRRRALADGTPLRLVSSAAETTTELPEERMLDDIAAGRSIDTGSEVFRQLNRRGLVTLDHTTTRRWAPSDEGRRIPLSANDEGSMGALTPEVLRTGQWQTRPFRVYDVRAPVPHVAGARPHPYLLWIRQFEEILIGLGFEQAEGPLLETEFWNSDVLFMPQDHPARSIHDTLAVEGVEGHLPSSELVERVAAVHEGRTIPGMEHPIGPGWRAPYDRRVAARPIPRSQTTAVSARFMAARPQPPFRMYSIDRNFRHEAVDATHHVEFAQCEGILGAEDVSLRDLVGIFQEMAEAIHIRELKFRPSYFPFTEPSIEGYVRHPRLGWIEVFPGGIFRPEVTRPLGVEVPVAAWGIGITRLAMIALGLNDIRELYLDDLGRLTQGPA